MAGFLFDKLSVKKTNVLCHVVYGYVLRVLPGNATDAEVSSLILSLFPDVQTWQFSGRRRCPLPALGRQSPRPVRSTVNYRPDGRVRPTQPDQIQYGFATSAMRDQAAASLQAAGFGIAFTFNEPNTSTP